MEVLIDTGPRPGVRRGPVFPNTAEPAEFPDLDRLSHAVPERIAKGLIVFWGLAFTAAAIIGGLMGR